MIGGPCKDCEKRTVGCHAKCEVYTEWRSKMDDRRRERLLTADACDYVRTKREKYLHNAHRKNRR